MESRIYPRRPTGVNISFSFFSISEKDPPTSKALCNHDHFSYLREYCSAQP
jgi:hypothetical protein